MGTDRRFPTNKCLKLNRSRTVQNNSDGHKIQGIPKHKIENIVFRVKKLTGINRER